MRTLFFLVFVCFFVQSALPQPPKPSDKSVKPSKKQIQEQLQQVKTDASQQITELENQITEANAKNENPETIKAMGANLQSVSALSSMMIPSPFFAALQDSLSSFAAELQLCHVQLSGVRSTCHFSK